MTGRQVRRYTIVEQAMERIRDLISSGAFKPGDRFPNEGALAERFGIGRSSIREVIKILHYIGVLNSSTGRGTYLLDWRSISSEAMTWTALLGENDYYELMDVRFALENSCIQALTRSYSLGEPAVGPIVERLEATVGRLQEAATRNDSRTLIEADYEFHEIIIQSHRNSVFSSIYEILRSFMIDATKEMLTLYQDPSLIYAEHRMLLDAVKTGDPDHVSELYLDHIENAKDLIKKSFA